jgi:hypothetical protein
MLAGVNSGNFGDWNKLMRLKNRMATLTLSLTLSAGAVLFAAPALAVTGWDRCTNGYSCYFSGVNGTGTCWAAPSNKWHDLPYRVLSVWNRGGGRVDFYDGGHYTGWSSPIGYKGSNGALIADRIYIVP